MEEIWRAIPEWEGLYEASSCGKIRSIDRHIECIRSGRVLVLQMKGRVLAQIVNTKGYLQVCLAGGEKVRTNAEVHRLVCLAFHGMPEGGHQAAHRDGDRMNCNEGNLRWATPSGNAQDKNLHGTALVGDRNPNARLEASIVRQIREEKDISGAAIARRLGVNRSTVNAVRRGKTWASV